MNKAKILFISQEMTPYLPETEISVISRNLPQGIQELGKEIRTLMPRYGKINERRHQLHEVIRLSGMNLIIDDADHPLIIKVASIQQARMQVYFIDNEDFFHRKFIHTDEEGNYFEDNDERMIFFARGVIETVKKLRWTPDIIHCHGWFTSFVPMLLKKVYSDDTFFQDAKIIFSLYEDQYEGTLDKNVKYKLVSEGMDENDLDILSNPTFENLSKLIIDNSDGIIIGSKNAHKELIDYTKDKKKPTLEYQDEENYIENYSKFYDKLLNS